LKEAGAIVFGRLNMDEFAMGSSTENSAFGVTRNPWDATRIPGGSSGGSAAAVAADPNASPRWARHRRFDSPARRACAVASDSSPLTGAFPVMAWWPLLRRSTKSAFCRDVRDAATVLGVISGHDPRDSTSVPVPVPDYAAALDAPIKGLKLGLPKEYMIGGLDAEVSAAVQAAVKQFEKLGAEIVEVSLPHTDYAVATYYIVATAEASANLARFDGIRYGRAWTARIRPIFIARRAGPDSARKSNAASSWARTFSAAATTTPIICGRRKSAL
jgi:aspartyl-tRNA(Asn)/glutamyl-tRNA(Gln) amidotransferase subunit A